MGVINISGISDSRVAPVVANLIAEEKGPSLIVTPTYIGARRLASDISFFAKKRIILVPEDDNVFRSYEAKNQDTLFGFLEALRAVAEGEDCIVVAPVGMAIKKLPPKERFLCKRKKVAVGDALRIKEFLQDLVDMGYERAPLVYGKGQFSMRGDIIDIFTPYDDLPVRIDLFDNEIESMKTFDPISQRSIEKIMTMEVYPAALIIREPDLLENAQKKIERAYKGLPERRDELLESIATGSNRQQLETYMDYFYDETSNLAGYFQPQALLVVDDPNRVFDMVEERQLDLKADMDVFVERGLIIKKDIALFPGRKDLFALYKRPRVVICTPFSRSVKGIDAYEDIRSIVSRQTLSYNGKMDILEKDLRRFLFKKYDITLVCSSEERYRNLKEFVDRVDLTGLVKVKQGNLTAGMEFPEERIIYITDDLQHTAA